MKLLYRIRTLLFILLFTSAPGGSLSATIASAEPWKAISYKELPEAGSSKPARSLGTGGNKLFVIDADSRVDISFNRDLLKQHLDAMASGDENALRRRLESLTEAATSLGEGYKATVNAWDAFNNLQREGSAQRDESSRVFRKLVTEATEWQNKILDPLQRAIQERLESKGMPPEEAQKNSQRDFDLIIRGGRDLYDWEALRDLLAREIQQANEAIAAQEAVVLEVQALWFSDNGTVPLRLPGWNTVPGGPSKPFRKITVLTAVTASKAEDLKEAAEKASQEGQKVVAKAEVASGQSNPPNNAAQVLRTVTEAAKDPLPPVRTIRHSAKDTLPETHFDLQAADGIQPGNRVEIQFKIFQGVKPEDKPEDKLDDVQPAIFWLDAFEVGKFGVQDAIVSSLAFAQQQDVDDWKPAATASWLVSYSSWPKGADVGRLRVNRLRVLSGIGISGSALDFDSTKDIEIGFGPTISLLNDFIQVGYGWNLLAEDKPDYWFLSVRILKGQGLIERFEAKKK